MWRWLEGEKEWSAGGALRSSVRRRQYGRLIGFVRHKVPRSARHANGLKRRRQLVLIVSRWSMRVELRDERRARHEPSARVGWLAQRAHDETGKDYGRPSSP